MTGKPIIWQGVYNSFDEATLHVGPSEKTNAFISGRWIKNSTDRARKTIAMAVEGGTARMHEYPLTVLISLLAANRERVRILDFGGGIGSSVPEVLASIPPDSRVEFVIIDNAATCTMGRDLFADEPRVSFVEELPATTEDFDILHCGSSM